MKYETVIGLEVHAELSTKSKIFCGCTTEFGGDVNTHCCPICIGMPGVLPVLNRTAVNYAIKAGLALNCTISPFSKMDRKNYYYPDLPKAYQTSQYDLPLCRNGHLDINVDGEVKRIRINRIHLEEDAGKLLHDQWDSGSLVDYNRGGVPLIEIVTEPDIRTPDEAKEFLEALKAILEYTEVSDCKMQEGSLRCDVNLSVRPFGQKEFGTRTEMKNLNSFRAAHKSIIYETKRQIDVLDEGGEVIQETRRWDDAKGKSFSMRSKEEAHDYRYFPEPDLIPIEVDEEWIERIKSTMPELPEQKRIRYIEEYGLPEYDANILTSSKYLADFFEGCVREYNNAKGISNWIMGDLLRVMNERSISLDSIPIQPANMAKLLKLIDDNTISGSIAKTVFEDMFETDKSPDMIIEEKGLKQISDSDELIGIVRDILDKNPKSIEDFKAGKTKAIGFLVGQTMKATKGKANPQIVNKILSDELNKY